MNEEIANLPNPTINLAVPPTQENKEPLVKGEVLMKYIDNVFEDIREDRFEIDQVKSSFLEMVLNGGDATGSSKEALINLIKMKADMTDKKLKAVELVSRLYAKDRESPFKYINANQHNEFKTVIDKRKLLKEISEGEKND